MACGRHCYRCIFTSPGDSQQAVVFGCVCLIRYDSVYLTCSKKSRRVASLVYHTLLPKLRENG